MKKRGVNSVVMAAALICTGTMPPFAQVADVLEVSAAEAGDEFTYEDFTCTYLEDGTVEISRYTGGASEVVIPDEINGCSVTAIGGWAFDMSYNLTGIEIPTSVTTIGYYAFSGCDSLTSIELPTSVTTIGDYAFEWCRSLTSTKIPASVTTIGDYAFSWCESLTSIEIPTSVTTIGEGAFGSCENLWYIDVDKNNKYYSSKDGILYDNTQATLICCPGGKTSIEIPTSVTAIGDEAFYGCDSLTNIEIPSSVKAIGDGAFEDCDSLTSIELPTSVTTIGKGAFGGCFNLWYIDVDKNNKYYSSRNGILYDNIQKTLICCPGGKTDIEIPTSVTTIGKGAFWGCDNLTSIELPTSVTAIGDSAFRSCYNLTSIELPTSVTTIGDYAFWGCDSLTNIEIPSSVKAIGDGAFEDCDSLTSIELPTSVTTIGDWAFSCCNSLTSMDIPEGVEEIGRWAFDSCVNLKWITIPHSVTFIGAVAFYGCENLSDIYYKGKEKEWNALTGAVDSLRLPANVNVHFIKASVFHADYYMRYQASYLKKNVWNVSHAEEIYQAGRENGLKDVAAFWKDMKGIMDAVDDPSAILDRAFEKKDMYTGILFKLFQDSTQKSAVGDFIDKLNQGAGQDQVQLLSLIEKNMKEVYDIQVDLANQYDFSSLTETQKENIVSWADGYFKQKYGTLTQMNSMIGIYKKVLGYVTDIKEYCEYVSNGVMLMRMSDGLKTVMLYMYSSYTGDDPDLKAALIECINLMSSSQDELIGKMGTKLLAIAGKDVAQYGINQLWDQVKKSITVSNPYAALIWLSYKSSLFVSETLWKSDGLAEAFCKMDAVLNIRELVQKAYDMAETKYKEKPVEETADTLLAAAGVYFQYLMEDQNAALDFIKTYDDAMVTKIAKLLGFDQTSRYKEIIDNFTGLIIEQKRNFNTFWLDEWVSQYPEERILYPGQVLRVVMSQRIACPVDVYVYDQNGQLIGSVTDGVVYCAEDAPLTIACEGEEKEIWFYEDSSDYTIKYVGTDEGTMDIQLQDYGDGEEVHAVFFDEVRLEEGTEYVLEELQENDTYSCQLKQSDTDERIEPDLDTEQVTEDLYEVRIEGGYLVTESSLSDTGKFKEGTVIDISLLASDTSGFIKWASSAGDIFEDAEAVCTSIRTVGDDIQIWAVQMLYGDVNADGTVDAKDAALLRRAVAGWDVTIDKAAADVDADGTIGPKDAALLRRAVAGWEVKLGA